MTRPGPPVRAPKVAVLPAPVDVPFDVETPTALGAVGEPAQQAGVRTRVPWPPSGSHDLLESYPPLVGDDRVHPEHSPPVAHAAAVQHRVGQEALHGPAPPLLAAGRGYALIVQPPR